MILLDQAFSDGPGSWEGGVVEDGALVLRLAPGAAPVQLETSLATSGWVRVSARLSTEGVAAANARTPACGLHLRVGGRREPVGGCAPDSPWTEVERILPAEGRLVLVLELGLPGVLRLDDLRVETVEPGWQADQQGPIRWHVLPGDRVPASIRRRAAALHAELAAFFEWEQAPVVDWWKYPDLATKARYSGDDESGSSLGTTVHSVHAWQPHQLVHVLGSTWGEAPPLVAEGLAVWLSGGWRGRPVREAARDVAWHPLAQLADPRGFRSLPQAEAYPLAGAFVGWLLERRGKGALRQLYGGTPFETAVGVDLPTAEQALRAWLGLAAPAPTE